MRTGRVFVVLAVIVLAAAAMVSCGSEDTTSVSVASTSTTSAVPAVVPSTSTASVFLLRNEKVGPVRRPVVAATPARSAMSELLAGPTAREQAEGLVTMIPVGTRLLGVVISNGIATVDLSKEFTTGGGSLSMQARVAQVVYTLTQFSTASSVNFKVDGAPLTVLGGEGITLDTPQTRADSENMTPAILVESPLPFDRVLSPTKITGTANTFEATFQITVTDSAGKKVYDHFATATSGSGTRGTFDESVTFSAAAPGRGTLEVFESSAEDGRAINVVKIPVDL